MAISAIANQIERLKHTVSVIRQRNAVDNPGDEDGFFTALGVDTERFSLPQGGYDAVAAISSTALEDWADYDTETRYFL